MINNHGAVLDAPVGRTLITSLFIVPTSHPCALHELQIFFQISLLSSKPLPFHLLPGHLSCIVSRISSGTPTFGLLDVPFIIWVLFLLSSHPQPIILRFTLVWLTSVTWFLFDWLLRSGLRRVVFSFHIYFRILPPVLVPLLLYLPCFLVSYLPLPLILAFRSHLLSFFFFFRCPSYSLVAGEVFVPELLM